MLCTVSARKGNVAQLRRQRTLGIHGRLRQPCARRDYAVFNESQKVIWDTLQLVAFLLLVAMASNLLAMAST